MTLLYIDDDEDDIEFLFEAISELKVQMKCMGARGGVQGLQLLKAIVPDYIFLDINMPEINGKEVLRQIRADIRLVHVPVIVFSTSISSQDCQSFLRIGANECIVKPSNLALLCKNLKKVFSADGRLTVS